MPKNDHDDLANFLIRRGHVNLAVSELNGLSLETYIDLCMRYERSDELLHLMSTRGSEVIPETCDWGSDYGYSAFFSLGMYMLGKDHTECTKAMITQAVATRVGKLLVDATKLAAFVSVVDETEGSALLQKVIEAMDLDINSSIASISIF